MFSGSGANTAVGVSATLSSLQLNLTQTSNTLLLQQDPTNFINWTVATISNPPEPATLKILGEARDPGPPPVESHFNVTEQINASSTTIASAVPEPSTATLGVLGAAAFIGYDWCRRRA